MHYLIFAKYYIFYLFVCFIDNIRVKLLYLESKKYIIQDVRYESFI